jgi:hypothetical protein
MDLVAAQALLQPFLDNNTLSAVDEIDVDGETKILAIKAPWGEESFVLHLSNEAEQLAQALNHVFLPERLTAVYHRDTKDLEFIWTARKLSQNWEEVDDRRFDFVRGDRTYRCEFARSSERVVRIAKHFTPVLSGAPVGYRNMISFHAWNHLEPTDARRGEPRSFWIRNVDWNEDDILDLVSHLNFYMTYYDHLSPTIVVHSPKSAQIAAARSRYVHGPFPSRIDSKPLDDVLLLTWEASRDGDAARKYLYSYRVIEFASYSYMEISARTEVRRLLAAPHALHDIRVVADAVAAAVQKAKLDDVAKFNAVLADIVSPNLIWAEICRNLPAFTEKVLFDGGYELQRLMAPGARETDFSMKLFGDTLRAIRNALAHGRDQRSAQVIAPTIRNFELLAPWASVASVAAGEIILYRDVI